MGDYPGVITGRNENLMRYLPVYYKENNIMTNLQDSVSAEFEELGGWISEVLQQLFVETATWGLDLWETELGIPTDTSKTEEARRNIILTKMRGAGVTTPVVLEDLAELFTGGQGLVIEYFDQYKFVVKFIGFRGVPPNLEDISAAIEEIKPAHLTYGYLFTYLIWYEAATYLWDEAGKMTWDQFRVAKPKHFRDPNGLTTWSDIYCAKKIPVWKSLRSVTWEQMKHLKLVQTGGI